MVKISEVEVERLAREARVICEASDGKVSDFAYELSKEVGRGNITADEAVALTRKHYDEQENNLILKTTCQTERNIF